MPGFFYTEHFILVPPVKENFAQTPEHPLKILSLYSPDVTPVRIPLFNLIRLAARLQGFKNKTKH